MFSDFADSVMVQQFNSNLKIFPVIHYLNRRMALDEVTLARRTGAHGVFLISHLAHLGSDEELLLVAAEAKREHPDFLVGVNLLSFRALEATKMALKARLDMSWSDQPVVSSTGLQGQGPQLVALLKINPFFQYFASVAFKYCAYELEPAKLAAHALAAGFVPTTSGVATGCAPEMKKIRSMSAATGGVLALASGMTPENVSLYAPYLSHILIATGVSLDEHRIDNKKLELLIANVCRG